MRTAESVSPMHPDKICDRISDAILDACLEQDPDSRVAIETMGGHGIITITGELTTNAYVDMREIAQKVAGSQYGVQVNVVRQSPEIAQGVDTGGAGDQGIMIGYAVRDTPQLLPLEVVLARSLNEFIYDKHPYDGKTQITVDKGAITQVVASFQNVTKLELDALITQWEEQLDLGVIIDPDAAIHINPAGDWNIGGFEADTGLTGRKLAVDNYGPSIPIGGGCFSGKDPSKVDRSAAYMARRIACEILRSNDKAHEVLVRLAYAIGYPEPVEATAIIDGKEVPISKTVCKDYDLTPKGIIDYLGLKRPIYAGTAMYGHFGHDFAWD